MDRDNPPFGPSDDGNSPAGADEHRSGRGANEDPRRRAPDADSASSFRFSRREQEGLPPAADQGAGGEDSPRRSFSRSGRFSRGEQARDAEPPSRASFPREAQAERAATTSGPPERGRAPRMERPSFLDRANDDDDLKPSARRPSFLEGSREELRPESKSPSFLDRANDNSDADPKRPSFLERFRPDDSLGDGMTDADRQPFDARDDIDAPEGRSYRDSLPRDNGTGADAYGAERAPRSRERQAAPSFERGDPGFARGSSAERDRRFDLGQTTRSRRDEETSSQASKDWRSSRFTSRFSQPPKAYDLDEVGDQNIAFDPVEDTGSEPPYEMDREAVPRYSEEDLLKKARARSRSRFSRSRAPADDDYAPRTAVPADLSEPEPFEDELAAQPDYAEERRYQGNLADPADDLLQPVEEFDDQFLDEDPAPAGTRDTELGDYGAVGEFDQGQRYYDTADAIDDPAPAASPDLPLIDDLAQDPPASTEMRAPRGQSYADEPQDNYYSDADSVQRGYDDYDTGGRRVEPRAASSGDELRADRAPSAEAGYPQYSDTFKDYEEKGNRKPLLLIGALAGVAVVAGGLIFAYQMFSPGGGSKDVVPVVKLEEAPSKVAPNDPGGLQVPHQNKLIYDRIVGEETAVAEKVVPREEKVIELDTPAADSSGTQGGSDTSGDTAVAVPPPPVSPTTDGGNISDTGREEAVAILQTPADAVSSAVPEPPDTPIPPPVNEVTVQPAVPEPPQPATPEAPAQLRTETVEAPAPATRNPPPVPLARPEAPTREVAASEPAASSGSGPIQLAPLPPVTSEPSQPVVSQAPAVPTTPVQSSNISEPAPAPPAPEPTRVVTAQPTPPPAAPSPAPSAASGEYLIQIAAFRTQPEAEKEYAKLRGKHAGLLQPYGPLIQKADLGSRGIFYRLRVGPMQTKADASALCNSLIAAGEKDCLVRRAR